MPDDLEKEQLENKEEVLLAASLYIAQPATPGPTIDKGFVPSSLAESQLCLHFIVLLFHGIKGRTALSFFQPFYSFPNTSPM